MRRGLTRAGVGGAARLLALPALLLMALAGNSRHHDPPEKQAQDPDSFRISVDVSLVVLHATVTDRQGDVVSSLGERDFAVFEDGVEQRIRVFTNEDIPVTVGLVIDHSTTMHPKIAEVTAAARTFARSSNPQDEMFVVNFNEMVSLGLPAATRFTNQPAMLEQAIAAGPVQGKTALYDAIAKALLELKAGTREKKVLIVVSDGGDNASVLKLADVMNLAGQSGAVIYTVGVYDLTDPDHNPGVLKRLSRVTGGEAFFPNELSQVVAISERIARDIRHQYTIGYVPTNLTSDGSFRTIRLVARAKDQGRLSVRTRTGYYPGGASRQQQKKAAQ